MHKEQLLAFLKLISHKIIKANHLFHKNAFIVGTSF